MGPRPPALQACEKEKEAENLYSPPIKKYKVRSYTYSRWMFHGVNARDVDIIVALGPLKY